MSEAAHEPTIESNLTEAPDNTTESVPIQDAVKVITPLTPEIISQSVSVISRTGNGLSHAYVKLEVHGQGITSLDGLNEYPHLRYVDLSDNAIREIEPIGQLEFLLCLDLHKNSIRSIPSNLDKCKFLQTANFSKNQLLLLDIVGWPMLSYLNLSQNDFMQMNLRDFPELAHFEVRENKLSSTQGINAPKLKKLYAAQNNISRLEGIDDKYALELLHLRNNKLQILDGFSSKMTSLKYINLRANEVASLDEISKLNVLPGLDAIVLLGNPIDQIDNYRIEVLSRLPTLKRLDKDRFSDEEKEEADQLRVLREEKAKAEAKSSNFESVEEIVQ